LYFSVSFLGDFSTTQGLNASLYSSIKQSPYPREEWCEDNEPGELIQRGWRSAFKKAVVCELSDPRYDEDTNDNLLVKESATDVLSCISR
jgi:hypothetical protein